MTKEPASGNVTALPNAKNDTLMAFVKRFDPESGPERFVEVLKEVSDLEKYVHLDDERFYSLYSVICWLNDYIMLCHEYRVKLKLEDPKTLFGAPCFPGHDGPPIYNSVTGGPEYDQALTFGLPVNYGDAS